jgi:hypothetical protein
MNNMFSNLKLVLFIITITMSTAINTLSNCQIQLGDDLYEIPQKNEDVLNMIKDFHTMENLVGIPIIKLDSNTFHDTIFMKLLGNVSDLVTFNDIITLLKIGNDYFNNMEISINIESRIEKWIADLGNNSYTWTELTDKPNYSLELFKKRFWPYFNVECKDWQDIALNNINVADYPHQSNDTNISDELLLVSETSGTNDVNKACKTIISKDYKVEFDISQKYNNYLGYSVLKPNEYPNLKSTINILKCISSLNLTQTLFVMVAKILTTPSMCHIIKDIEFWDTLKPYLKNSVYNRIVLYYMYYAVFIMYHEYVVMFSQVKRNHRIIFTHQEALAMPQTYMYHITIDPYIQQLTGDQFIIQSVPYYLRCKRYIQPIDVFERRFYLATGGALANIPLYKFNAAVSGSILIPCISYSELEDAFEGARFNTSRSIDSIVKYPQNIYTHVLGGDNDNNNNKKISKSDMDFISYLEYYYPSYYSLQTNDYIKKVLTFVEDIPRSANDEKDEKDEKDENDRPVKLQYNLLSDIDISITTDNYDTFEILANMIILQIQMNCHHIGKVWGRKIYTKSSFKYKVYGPGLLRPIDLFRVPYGPEKMVKKFHCPIVRSWYDGSNDVVVDTYNHTKKIDDYWKSQLQKNPNTWEDGDFSYKDSDDDDDIDDDNIDDDNINDDNIDDDNINDDNIDNDNIMYGNSYKGVNILLSCVFAILSGVNTNYKWFFNSKPCVEVILKYAQRGFTTIITQNEKNALVAYMITSPKWKHFVSQISKNLRVTSKNIKSRPIPKTKSNVPDRPPIANPNTSQKNDVIDMVGQVNKHHIFFSPCVSGTGIRYNLRQFNTTNKQFYSKKMYVGILKPIGDCKLNTSVKTNTKVYAPDMTKVSILNSLN